MELRLSLGKLSEPETFMREAETFLEKTKGPLRLAEVFDHSEKQKIPLLRERTWNEFFLEMGPWGKQRREDVQNETCAAIEQAFSLAIHAHQSTCTGSRAIQESGMDGSPGTDASSANAMVVWTPEKARKEIDSGTNSLGVMDFQLCAEDLMQKVSNRPRYLQVCPDSRSTQIKSQYGLFTAPEGFSISCCPALQVAAHKVIVGSVGAYPKTEAELDSPFERAVQAFDKAWKKLEKKTLPRICKLAGEKRSSIVVIQEKLHRGVGLRHIRDLNCIADDRSRTIKNALAKLSVDQWKRFYLEGSGLEGESVVRELYPDYYVCDETAPDGRKPFYSDENLKGAVEAGNEIILACGRAKKPRQSFMLAGMDQSTFDRLSRHMKSVEAERANKGNDKDEESPMDGSPPPRKSLPDDLVTPLRLPPDIQKKPGLQKIAREVPRIRATLDLGKVRSDLLSESDSDD